MKLKRKRPFTILINGWYGHFNAGDDAILRVFVDQVTSRIDCEIVVLSENPENIAPMPCLRGVYHPSLFGRSLLRHILDGSLFRHVMQLARCDLFVLGGGGLLRDNTSWRNLIRLLDEIWIAKLFGCKVMLYAIGVGPFKSRLGKFLIGASVRMCDLVTVRSEKDAQLLHTLSIEPERIHVVADPAYLLQSEAPKDKKLIEILSGSKKIGVFPTISLIIDGQDFSHLIRFAAGLDSLAEDEGLQFVILPMRVCESEMDDVQIAHAIKSAMKHPEAVQIYERRLTPSELKWVTNKTLLNITLRLHAMIFSLGSNAPVVAINYEPKVSNVFDALKCPEYLVEMDSTLDTALVSSVKQCLNNLPSYMQAITILGPSNEISALHTFELMQSIFPTNRRARIGKRTVD